MNVSAELHEVLNYVRAAEDCFEWLEDGRPINLTLLNALQARLVSGTRSDGDQAGRIRTVQVVIGAQSDGIESARFIPQPPGALLEESVRELLAWMQSPPPDLPAVVAAAMAHYQFEALHPYKHPRT